MHAPTSAERIKFALRVVTLGAIAMVVMSPPFVICSFYSGHLPRNLLWWLSVAAFVGWVLAAIAVLTGYILLSRDLLPVKAMFFGAGSVGAAVITPLVLAPILTVISEISDLSLLSSRTGGLLLALAFFGFFGVVLFSGIVAFVFGLIRLFRKSRPVS